MTWKVPRMVKQPGGKTGSAPAGGRIQMPIKAVHLRPISVADALNPELAAILAKPPNELTKDDVAKIIAAIYSQQSETDTAHEISPADVAEGMMALKEDYPDQYARMIEADKALAAGNYTPGRGVFAKKHVSGFLFPAR